MSNKTKKNDYSYIFQEPTNGFKSDFNSLVIGYPDGINCRDINILNYLMYNVKTSLKRPGNFSNVFSYPLADLYDVVYNSNHRNYHRNLSRLDYSLRVYGGNQNGSTSIKLAQISLNEVNKQGFFKSFPMFSEIEYSSDLIFHAEFNPKCIKYFTDLDIGATFYALKSILEIKNKYAKILLPHLSQYRNTGKYVVNISEMFNYFGLGNKITQSYLVNKIIPKAMKALLPYFPQLHLTIYQRPNRIKMPTMLNQQGVLTNINYLCFTFKPHLKIGYHTKNKALINIPDKDLITKTKALPFDKGIKITNKNLPF